jgi:outer membrane protein TolC
MSRLGSSRPWLPAALFVLALALSGCVGYNDTFVHLPANATDLHTIAPFDPATLPPAEAPPADAVADAPPAAPPPAEVTLTMEECRAAAISNNLSIQSALVDPAIATDRVSEEEARFEAVFQTSSTYTKTDTPLTTVPTGVQSHVLETQTGVEVPLRTGGTLRFNLADVRTHSFPDGGDSLDPVYDSAASVSFSQPLLRNAGRRANTYAIRLALYGQQIAQTTTRLEIIRVLAAVDRVYWRLYASRGVLEVRRQDYDLAQKQLDTARRLVDSGERSAVEVLRAESALASRLEGIITADNAVRDRQRELKRAINRADLPLDSATVIVPGTEPDPQHYQFERATLTTQARRNRMELLDLELQLAQSDSTVEYLRNQLLPLVMLDYTYNVNGLGDSRDDSYDLLGKRRFADHRAGISLLVPLGNGAAESRLLQALLSRRQKLSSKAEREALVEQEVLMACDTLEAAWQRILANRQSVLLAQRLLDAERRQYELGLNTSNDVLLAQAKLADAQSAEIQALAEHQIALIDTAYATGTVLGAAKLRWQETAAP